MTVYSNNTTGMRKGEKFLLLFLLKLVDCIAGEGPHAREEPCARKEPLARKGPYAGEGPHARKGPYAGEGPSAGERCCNIGMQIQYSEISPTPGIL